MSLVGGYVALSKPLVAAFPVLLLAWLRFGIAALAMPHWLKRTPDEPPMTSRTRWLVFLESFLGNFMFSICMLFGVSLTSAVSAGVIMASIPACVAVLCSMSPWKPMARQQALKPHGKRPIDKLAAWHCRAVWATPPPQGLSPCSLRPTWLRPWQWLPRGYTTR